MMNNELYELTKSLVQVPSVTPEDCGCQNIIAHYLKKLGFTTVSLPCPPVDNLWAVYGNTGPLFVFAGHTDIVDPGPVKKWRYDPYTVTLENELIFGRGVADMKGSLAAMLVATKRFLEQHPDFPGSIGFLITSGEEGRHTHLGTPKVIDYLIAKQYDIQWCLVGEPTSLQQTGDMLKCGRRGSLGGELTIKGKQGHIAYPHLADNPIHKSTAFLHEFCLTSWDQGNEYFQPTSMQISGIESGIISTNVIPENYTIHFNFRFSPESSPETLKNKVQELLDKHELQHTIEWRLYGEPFYTEPGILIKATENAIAQVTGLKPELSTSGGTSDARFIAKPGCEVIELGPPNATIHQINEHIKHKDIEDLCSIYTEILKQLFIVKGETNASR